MKQSERMYNGQVEITDLIAEAVSNAEARRKQALNSEECLSQLSDEQSGAITGGSIVSPLKSPAPIVPCPAPRGPFGPCLVGLLIDPPPSIFSIE